VMSTIVLSQI